jgi:YesN/AraC family two-component response regulator
VQRAKNCGALEFLTKPKTEQQLAAALNRVIQKVL